MPSQKTPTPSPSHINFNYVNITISKSALLISLFLFLLFIIALSFFCTHLFPFLSYLKNRNREDEQSLSQQIETNRKIHGLDQEEEEDYGDYSTLVCAIIMPDD